MRLNKDMTKLVRAARSYAPALGGHFAKYPTFCLRLALTLHCTRFVHLPEERLIEQAADLVDRRLQFSTRVPVPESGLAAPRRRSVFHWFGDGPVRRQCPDGVVCILDADALV